MPPLTGYILAFDFMESVAILGLALAVFNASRKTSVRQVRLASYAFFLFFIGSAGVFVRRLLLVNMVELSVFMYLSDFAFILAGVALYKVMGE